MSIARVYAPKHLQAFMWREMGLDRALRALWAAARAEGGLAPSRVPEVLAPLGPEAVAIALRRAVLRGHLIEVSRHTPDAPPIWVYVSMGKRP